MELYAIKYGTAPFPLRYIYKDRADTREEIPTDWLMYLAFVGGGAILFDTGFRDDTAAAEWDLRFTGYSGELNALPGTQSVGTVVITHAHFDHINNLDLYPAARVVIARGALEQAQAECPEPVRKRLEAGPLTVVDGETDIAGIFKFRVIGGHDAGSSVIYFTHAEKEYVMTGDECYACANIRESRPIGSVYGNAEANTAFTFDAHRRGLIPLPCHDSAVFREYPPVSDNIVRII